MVTLKEIAKECNVSATTVSNILNGKTNVGEETKKRVLEVVKQRGYRPNFIAQGLRNSRTRVIGIIAEDINQFSTPGIMEGIMEYCEEKGYRVLIQNLRLYARWKDTWFNSDAEYRSVFEPALEQLLSIQVDGIIHVAGHARYINCYSEDFGKPIVMVYAYPSGKRMPAVVIDDEKSSYEMVRHLIAKGHKKIAVIAGRADNIHTQKRLAGYQRALYDENLLFNPDWVFYGNWEKDSGYELAEAVLSKDVTAVYCLSDRMAGGFYRYCNEKHIRIGEDISVAGFDNQEISDMLSPTLTTMDLQLPQIGRRSADLLIRQIENSDSLDEQSFRMEEKVRSALIERESVLDLNSSAK